MRIAIKKLAGFAMAAMLVVLAQPIYAQNDAQIATLQQKLKEQFTLTRVASNGDIVAAGSVLVLQKEGLQMCGTSSPLPLESTYKNGKLSGGQFGWGMALALMSVDSNTIPTVKFVPGDKFWVTAYSVDKNGVHLKFWSDPINDIRYYGQLKIPFAKGSVPSVDDVMKTIAEVVTAEPADNAAQSAPAPVSAEPPAQTAEAAPAPIAPPPPPPAQPKTVALGQSKDQVLAVLGQPLKVANLGVKEIDYYSDMKVIFVKGTVADIQ
jgi:hypothetical protein